MRKSVLAAAVFMAFTANANAQSSVTLYGFIDSGLAYTNNQLGHSNWQALSNATQNNVFGLKGAEDLGGGLQAVFRLEQGFLANNGAQAFPGDAFGSQAWVGLQSADYGTITLGRQYDVLNDVVGPLTAGFNAWGGSVAGHPFENDNLAANSPIINNTVKFTSPTYLGITFETMYSFSNAAGRFANNRAYGFSIGYVQGPISLAAGYLQLDNPGGGALGTNPNGATSLGDGSAIFVASRHRIWSVGGSYNFGPATVGVVWSHSQIDNVQDILSFGSGYLVSGNVGVGGVSGSLRMDNFEVNGKYSITPAVSIGAAYTFTTGAYQGTSPKWHTAALQTTYSLSKRTDLYLEGVYQHTSGAPSDSILAHAMINTLSPSSTGTQVTALAGIRHSF